MLWKSKSEQRNASFPQWNSWAPKEWTAKYRSSMMQPRTTGTCHKYFQTCQYIFHLFHILLKLLAWGKKYFGHQTFPFLLVCSGAVSFASPLWGSVTYSEDAIDEDGHDGSTYQARDGHCNKPCHEDISKQTPVYCLPWTQPSNCHDRANLKTEWLSEKSQFYLKCAKSYWRESWSILRPSTRLFTVASLILNSVFLCLSRVPRPQCLTSLPCSGWWKPAAQC